MVDQEQHTADSEPSNEQIAPADAPEAVVEAPQNGYVAPESIDAVAEPTVDAGSPLAGSAEEAGPAEGESVDAQSAPEGVASESGAEAVALDSGASNDFAPEYDLPEAVAGETDDHEDFLGELARAMHTAAESQYERMNAELERRRAEQVEAIAARASSEAENLRAGTEADIGSIDTWAKSEAEKIKRERQRRIDARRELLATHLDHQETIKAREVFAIEVAIDEHKSAIESFFERMERESDPAAIARVASTLPAFPALADIAAEARRDAAAELAILGDDMELEPMASTDEGPEPDSSVSESRLLAFVSPPGSSDSNGDVAEPGDATVASPAPEPGAQGEAPPQWPSDPHPFRVVPGARGGPALEPPMRIGATLLRSIPSIRPMAGPPDAGTGEDSAKN